MNETMGILERNGCPLHYWISGRTDAPLIVLTHGASVDHRMFDAQMDVLKDYRVLRWDMRGHGESHPMGEDFTVPGSVEDLLAILDAIQVDRASKAIYLGQSTGGYVAQEMVFRHPERVSALLLVDCTCITLPISTVERLTLASTPYMFMVYPFGLLKRQTAQQSSIKPEVQRYITETVDKLSRRDFLKIWTGIAQCLHYEPGYSIPQPILLVQGDHDTLGNIAKIAPAWAKRDPKCEFVLIPDAGHCSNQDNPAVFNRTMMEFLRKVIVL